MAEVLPPRPCSPNRVRAGASALVWFTIQPDTLLKIRFRWILEFYPFSVVVISDFAPLFSSTDARVAVKKQVHHAQEKIPETKEEYFHANPL